MWVLIHMWVICESQIRVTCEQCTPRGWLSVIKHLFFIGQFPQNSPKISGSFAERDLQLKASHASSPPCTQPCSHTRGSGNIEMSHVTYGSVMSRRNESCHMTCRCNMTRSYGTWLYDTWRNVWHDETCDMTKRVTWRNMWHDICRSYMCMTYRCTRLQSCPVVTSRCVWPADVHICIHICRCGVATVSRID